MRATYILVLLLLTVPLQGRASAKTITYYLDGARVEYEARAKKGYLEIPLPAVMIANSLRLKPLDGGAISRVEIVPVKPDTKTAKETAALIERKNLLKDRLKALDTREDIFKAAAKSQSGRAVRKSKNNPEPMTNIRKGTEFAIAQLESVYTVRRKTESELALLEARLLTLERDRGAGGSVGKVWLGGSAGRIHVGYLLAERKWSPQYDLRLDATGFVRLILRADYPLTDGAAAVFVAPLLLSDDVSGSAPLLAVSGRFGKAGEYVLPVEKEEITRTPAESLAITFKNTANIVLPAGTVACYRRGEFFGNVNFAGCR
ncbi:MAG: hypothetical protein WCG31_02390, partial [Deltaproteobacteria bacterium]